MTIQDEIIVSCNKHAMYEAICRAQSEEVHPEDYGFEDNDYESLWDAVQHNGHLMMTTDDGEMFRDEEGHPVFLYKECGFETPQELQLAWLQAKKSIETFIEYLGE